MLALPDEYIVNPNPSQTENPDLSSYRVLKDAIKTVNNDSPLKMYYGFTGKASKATVVFALSDIYQKLSDEDIYWVKGTVLTPANMKAHYNAEDLTTTVDGIEYTPKRGMLYYRNADNEVKATEEYASSDPDVIEVFMSTFTGGVGEIPKVVENAMMKNPNYQTKKDFADQKKREMDDAETTMNNAKKAMDDAETTMNNAKKAMDGAETTMNNAKKAMDDAEEAAIQNKEKYKTINVDANFDAPSTVFTKWPKDYTINGNGHIINVAAGKALFTTNEGNIDGLATPDGRIATNNYGTITNSLTLWGNEYHAYDDVAKQIIKYSAEDAIYEMRNVETFLFGYDIKTDKVMPITEDTKLYQAKYANAENKTGYTFRFNTKGDEMVYDTETFNEHIEGGYTLQNAMLYIENNDVPAAIKNKTNVAVKGSNGYVCSNAILEEGANIKEFYLSDVVKATKLSYGREFKQDVAAVCLPFALTANFINENNIEVFQFNEVDANGVMWFTSKSSIAANKPCLIRFKGNKGAIFANLSNQTLGQTPAELVENIGEYKFCGTYASVYPADLIGNSRGALYGVQNGGLVKTDANSTSRLHQFRSYVWQPNAVSANAAPSYKIGLMDEDGNELSTAIETVSGEIISGFKAKGGDNAIEITTDKACPVKVYALNGALVKSTRVEAGSTSLPVKAGMYVVNGTKVIVK